MLGVAPAVLLECCTMAQCTGMLSCAMAQCKLEPIEIHRGGTILAGERVQQQKPELISHLESVRCVFGNPQQFSTLVQGA